MEDYTIKTDSGEIIDLRDDENFCKHMLSMVSDPAARSLLYYTSLNNTDELSILKEMRGRFNDPTGLVKVMLSTISLAFVTVIGRWVKVYTEKNNWGDSEAIEAFESARFSKLFSSAMGKEDISLDLQIFSLIELWVCLRNHSAVYYEKFACLFAEGIMGENIGLILQNARDAIKIHRGGFNPQDTDEFIKCKKLCFQLISAFPFLSDVKIQFPDGGELGDAHSLAISYKGFKGKSITVYPNDIYGDRRFVITQKQLNVLCGAKPGYGFYLLLYFLSETSVFNDKYQHVYRAFEDGEKDIKIEQMQESENTKSDLSVQPVKKSENSRRDLDEMRKFMSFNYKNIREFAMIISDAIKEVHAVREQIIEICKEKYPKILPDVDNVNVDEIYWDNVITLLLVEMGPSELLECVVQDETIYNNIINHIGWRCVGRDGIKRVVSDYKKKLADLPKNNQELLKAQQVELRVKKVLEIMNFAKRENDDVENFKYFEETLSYKYNSIVECIDVLEQYKTIDFDTCDKYASELARIFKNIFLFLQVFYTGLDGYAIENAKFDTLQQPDEDEDLIKERLRKQRGDCLKKFIEVAAKKFSEIENDSVGKLFDDFCDLCDKYNLKSEAEDEDLEMVKRLKKLITRSYICDGEKLRYFAEIMFENGKKSNIFEMLENFGGRYTRDINFLTWLEYFKDIFFFLIYNEDYSQHGVYKQKDVLKDKDCDPIYPYLITYYNENVDRDSIKKCTYRVPVPVAGGKANAADQGFIVTILSENNFPPTPYFCIPLRYGSSDNWWINPFLIPRGFVRRLELKVKENASKSGEQYR